MKKSDLKTGHVVELRDGQRGLIVTNLCNNCYCDDGAVIFAENNWSGLDSYSDDLKWCFLKRKSYSEYDIIKVFKPSTPNNYLNFKTLNDHLKGKMELVWEWKENITSISVEKFPNKTIITVTRVN